MIGAISKDKVSSPVKVSLHHVRVIKERTKEKHRATTFLPRFDEFLGEDLSVRVMRTTML